MVDLSTSSSLLSFLQSNGYFIVFLIMLAEGAVITYVASFAASLGIFNVYIVLILSILASIIADFVHYSIGRFGKGSYFEKKLIHLVSAEKAEHIKHFFRINVGKTMLVIKLTPALPMPGFVLAGASGVSIKKFLAYSVIISIVYSSFFVTLGFFSGAAFTFVYKYIKYGELLIGILALSVLILFLIIRKVMKKVTTKIEKI